MRNQSLLIARALALPFIRTKVQLARRLEMGDADLRRVERGDANFTPRQVVRLGEVLGQPWPELLVLVQEDRAKTDDEREFWRRLGPRVVATAALWTVSAVVAAALGIGSHNVYRGEMPARRSARFSFSVA